MKINEAYVIDYLTYKAGRPLKIKELAKEMNVSGKDYGDLRSLINNMVANGRLVKLRRGRIGIPSEMNLVVGSISISRTGYGTVYSESGEPIVIPPAQVKTAFDGDRVVVRIEVDENDDQYGRVLRITERAEQKLVGILYHGRGYNYVIADNKKIRRDIYIPKKSSKKARDGERVVIKIASWDDINRNPEGEVIERLGIPGSPGVDLLTVIKKYELPEDFPAKVVHQAESASKYLDDREFEKRRNFTDKIVYTVDPSDAKDHDDAVSVEKIRGGFRLGVYIADVSHFVRAETILDEEALRRGNSVYLPGKVIPMLPEKLSNDLCSLKPNRRRLVYAIHIDFDHTGKMVKWDLSEGAIKSRAKLSYEEVQAFFDNSKMTPRIKRVAANLSLARKLAGLLLRKRMANGSLDFDLPESKITLNQKGEIIEIANKVRLESHRLIEEFMLAANQAVAIHVFRLARKFLYRVHDRPDKEKVEAFSYLVASLGYRFPVSPAMKPIQFARFLNKLKGKPEEEFLNELMLRSMQKAVYQPKNIGHFGLAFTHYTHFTSPIRRYPDLMVHRLLKSLKKGRYPHALDKKLDIVLVNIGRHCSETERVAEEAEREAIKMKQVAYMADHIGEEFSGVISGILSFGFFVRLDNLGVEGMIRLSSLDDDYYHFDEEKFRLVGKRSGRVFQLGDAIRVGVLSADIVKNELDLFLAESSTVKKMEVPKKWKRRKSSNKKRRRRK
jgi:ribonuclease R